MTVPYGGEDFTWATFLVFCNRVFNLLFASSMIVVNKESFQNKAPLWKYMVVSLSNVAASSCQYAALRYVSFPVQMLGKSFKMMPVMLWGIFSSRKRYSLADWLVAFAVTMGVTEFLMTGNITSHHHHEASHASVKGLLLLVIFLACDGLTSTMQEKLFKEYNTSKYNQMFFVNGCSGLTSIIALALTSSTGPCLDFISRHPRFLLDAAVLSATATASQWFIYSQVKEFGAVVFAATMNVRQVASILVSYATYGHLITVAQIFGLGVVFAALFYKSYSGLRSVGKEEATYLLSKDVLSKQGGSQPTTAKDDAKSLP